MSQPALPEPNVLFLHVMSFLIGIIGKLYFRLTCHRDRAALRELSEQPRPAIIVFNHTSNLDVPAVGLCVGVPILRRTVMPGKKELFEKRLTAWFMRQGGAIPLNRDITDTTTVRTLLRALQAGRFIIMSPEGTRSHDGTVQEFKPGFIKLAHRTNALIVPVGIQGAHEAFGRGMHYPKPRKLSVRVGAVIDIANHLPDHPSGDDYATGAELVRQRVIDLLS